MATKTKNIGRWPSVGQFVTAGFGIGIGSLLATMLFMIIAVSLFVPGYVIVKKQNAKEKEERSTGTLVIGFILMGLGMVLGLGFGAGVFFGALGDSL
jgi:hypothetical protein